MQLVTVDDVLGMMGDTSNLEEKGELEKLIQAVGRVFSTNDGSEYIAIDDPEYIPYPTGYSGEVNKVRAHKNIDIIRDTETLARSWRPWLKRSLPPFTQRDESVCFFFVALASYVAPPGNWSRPLGSRLFGSSGTISSAPPSLLD